MFHRIGPAAYKADLNNTLALCERINNPERGLKCVHVAGTNGKGSTCHLIASVLQEAGYKTGLFTSPHLVDFRERIRINGKMIPEEEVVQFVDRYSGDWSAIQPSFFEMTTAMAFWYFKKNQCEISVIETGMGGRLDSTNVVVPEVSVITHIGYDHMNFLGDTIEKIAAEKGGIIKPGVPVVLGEMRKEAESVLREMAHQKGSEMVLTIPGAAIPATELKGKHQQQNANTAFQAIAVLRKKGWNISDEHIEKGFAHVVHTTGLRGRWETLQQRPWVIADVAHNEDGMLVVLQQLKNVQYERLHIVLGVVGDKQPDRVLRLLPASAVYYFCKAGIPRGMDAEQLRKTAEHFHLEGSSYPDVATAYATACGAAAENDLVLVTGSIFTVAEVLNTEHPVRVERAMS